jgi:hypothetical protein
MNLHTLCLALNMFCLNFKVFISTKFSAVLFSRNGSSFSTLLRHTSLPHNILPLILDSPVYTISRQPVFQMIRINLYTNVIILEFYCQTTFHTLLGAAGPQAATNTPCSLSRSGALGFPAVTRSRHPAYDTEYRLVRQLDRPIRPELKTLVMCEWVVFTCAMAWAESGIGMLSIWGKNSGFVCVYAHWWE